MTAAPGPMAPDVPPPAGTRFWTRPDGGTLAWDEYGDPHGWPVFYFHGWPSSRLQGSLVHDLASRRGLRVICPDRPGIGLSTIAPGRHLRDWPPLLEAFCAHLAIDRFSLLGVSGGGPYVLATVAALPARVRAAAVVCGAVPMAELPDRREMLWAYRVLMPIRHLPPVLLAPVFSFARWVSTLDPARPPFSWFMKMVPPEDREAVLRSPETQAVLLGSFREAFRQGPTGVMADAEIYFHPWGLDYSGIDYPIGYWHGARDRNIPLPMARWLFDRLPGARTVIAPDLGHYSIALNMTAEVVEYLVRATDNE